MASTFLFLRHILLAWETWEASSAGSFLTTVKASSGNASSTAFMGVYKEEQLEGVVAWVSTSTFFDNQKD